jgi:hypothetical protein
MRRFVLACIVFTGCAGGGGGDQGAFDPASWSGGMTGGMQVRLVDAPNTDVKSVVVTITHVDAHVAGAGWQTIASTRVTIDLLALQGGTFALLGVAQLPAGQLTELRLYVDPSGDNHVVGPDGVQHPLTVPSGPESGIKLKLGLALPACATGHLTLDFDGKKSIWVHPHGNHDDWILRPVVRLTEVTAVGSCPPGPSPSPGDTPPSGSTPPPTNPDPPGATNPPSPSSPPSPPTSPTPPPGTVVNGSPVDCGGATCAVDQVCYNGACTGSILVL